MKKPEKKRILNFLEVENEHVMDMLITYDVPDSVEGADDDDYLLPTAKKIKSVISGQNNAQLDELEDRLNTIKNKMKSKKSPVSERAKKKREAKKLKKNKEFKKILVSAAKSIKNENNKLANSTEAGSDDESEKKDKKNIKLITPKPIFNEEGKIVFSKFDFASHPGAKTKKSHKNPRDALREIKAQSKKIEELKEQGDAKKAAEIQNELAWKKAFDKTEGKKVKDDPKLLYKTLKKKKVEKKKSKKQWKERQSKVQGGIEQRQKKREENINKRIKDKQNKKLKRLSKKGRVIPGF